MATSTEPGSRSIALVIGSGGVKCAAALGFWSVLQREGIAIAMAVGSSGGSIFAALIALGALPPPSRLPVPGTSSPAARSARGWHIGG